MDDLKYQVFEGSVGRTGHKQTRRAPALRGAEQTQEGALRYTSLDGTQVELGGR